MNPMIAVGFDSLLTLLLFVIIAGVSSWLKKKQSPEDSDSRSEPPASAPPTPQRGSPAQPSRGLAGPLSWEEELRRLLQGKPETPPPPVMVRQEPAPPAKSRPSPPRPTAPRLPTAPRQERLARGKMPTRATEVAKLEEIQEKARELERQVHHRLSPAQVSLRQSAEVPGAQAAAERSAARAMLRDRHSIRSAVMVSTILGPPRALDDRPAYPG